MKIQTALIEVIMALDRSSIFPKGSEWTTKSPFVTLSIGIHFALRPLRIFTKISVSAVKQAVPLLLCPLALACLLLHLSYRGNLGFCQSWFSLYVLCSYCFSVVCGWLSSGFQYFGWADSGAVALRSENFC